MSDRPTDDFSMSILIQEETTPELGLADASTLRRFDASTRTSIHYLTILSTIVFYTVAITRLTGLASRRGGGAVDDRTPVIEQRAECTHPHRERENDWGFFSAETVCRVCGQYFDPVQEARLRERQLS